VNASMKLFASASAQTKLPKPNQPLASHVRETSRRSRSNAGKSESRDRSPGLFGVWFLLVQGNRNLAY
jgi:hypothetical protein